MHLHLASHLGALDEPREGRDGGPIPKMEGLSKCRDRRYSPSECRLTNTNLVLDLRQALEHSKPPMFLQILLDALGYKS